MMPILVKGDDVGSETKSTLVTVGYGRQGVGGLSTRLSAVSLSATVNKFLILRRVPIFA